MVLGHGHRNQIRIERESGAKLLVVPKNDANNGERNVGGHWQQDGYQMMLFLHQDSNNSKKQSLIDEIDELIFKICNLDKNQIHEIEETIESFLSSYGKN